MSLQVPTLVKDSLLDDGQLTTRDWTIDDNSLLALMNLFSNSKQPVYYQIMPNGTNLIFC